MSLNAEDFPPANRSIVALLQNNQYSHFMIVVAV